ncbi:MAG: hypothetical protein OMM_03920 [Candidatus Magnetoglobus multicellularis str. Araruama]|uniref:Uncharacterized protein n=1 Tax=Candidatus Magnetoglobus multicellularis str. Araruama TaxID=890399 RepID=A0A1V1P3R1_9BACT|nr:MAG: hypothetical protein OMM_03920 [Candidatus Magnetoglobus multicellularis str. Araruama]
MYGLIFSTSALQKYNLSKQYLEKLIQRDPDVADTSFIWQLIISNNWQDIPMKFANQYYLKGNFRRASQLSQMVLKKNPLHCQAQHVDIWCDLYQSHAMLALSQFNQFVANDSCNSVNGTIGQGVSLLYLGYFADAKSVLNTITTQSPHYLRSQVALGAIAYLEGDFQNAIDVYESRRSELLDIKDQFWPFLNLNSLGWSYIYQREYKNAETVFNQLDDIHNHLSGLHLFGLAWAKYKQGKIDDAVERLLDYPVDSDNHFKESMLLANAFYLKSDFDEAIAIYKEYMSDLPSKELFFSWGSYALQNLGWCYIHTHQYQKALQTFFKLKTYHPAPIYFVIYDNLGWAYYYLGMIDEAEKAFKYSLKIAPTNQLARDGMKKISYYRNRRT